MSTEYFGLIKCGNKKIGDNTLIFNMCAAMDCPSRALGLCQLCNPSYCYALGLERPFPNVLAYHRKQGAEWQRGYLVFSYLIGAFHAMRDDLKFVRFNESGDLGSQAEVSQLWALAREHPSLQFYGYSARSDLSYRGKPKNVSLCGSGWRRGRKMNEFRVVEELSGKNPVCGGNCRSCDLCKYETGIVIESLLRKGGKKKGL